MLVFPVGERAKRARLTRDANREVRVKVSESERVSEVKVIRFGSFKSAENI